MGQALRLPVEQRYPEEFAALRANDRDPLPPGWAMSPRSVETFILGSQSKPLEYEVDGESRSCVIDKKFYGDDVLVQRAIVTMASDRGLLLVGEPGTAKSWLSEHLAAAIAGDSMLAIQGSAGITEDQIKYSWNYALLLAEGPSRRALVPAPLYLGMRDGKIVRFEEITRAPHEVQDTLLSCMSDKVLIIPELAGADGVVLAQRGFNVIGTANTRDRGVNEMSAALKRRFNFETVHPIADFATELALVERQAAAMLADSGVPRVPSRDVLEVLVTTFRDLRGGVAGQGGSMDQLTTVMSTAEAVSVAHAAGIRGHYLRNGEAQVADIVQCLAGVAVKDNADDLKRVRRYLEQKVSRKKGPAWAALYQARHLL